MRPMIYIGSIPWLKEKLALVRDSPKPGFVLAQFDDINMVEGFGWHAFKINDFTRRKAMPRVVSVRRTYQSDVAYLSRLAQAVEKDTRRKEKWRKKVIKYCNEIMMELINADFGKGTLT